MEERHAQAGPLLRPLLCSQQLAQRVSHHRGYVREAVHQGSANRTQLALKLQPVVQQQAAVGGGRSAGQVCVTALLQLLQGLGGGEVQIC